MDPMNGWDGHAELAEQILVGEAPDTLAEVRDLVRKGVPLVELSAFQAYEAGFQQFRTFAGRPEGITFWSGSLAFSLGSSRPSARPTRRSTSPPACTGARTSTARSSRSRRGTPRFEWNAPGPRAGA